MSLLRLLLSPASRGFAPAGALHGSDALELRDARESLAYWEERLERLPLIAVRRRREARLMVARWRARVVEAEQECYGRGARGAVVLVATERRLPEALRYRGHVAARRAKRGAVVVGVGAAGVVTGGLALAVDAGVHLLRALGMG